MNWICTNGHKNSVMEFICPYCNEPQPEDKPPKGVKKVSDKRLNELNQYPKLKKQFLLHKMACEIKKEGCTITAVDIHHTSKSALNFLNTNTWVCACRSCHIFVETKMSAEDRRKEGLLID